MDDIGKMLGGSGGSGGVGDIAGAIGGLVGGEGGLEGLREPARSRPGSATRSARGSRPAPTSRSTRTRSARRSDPTRCSSWPARAGLDVGALLPVLAAALPTVIDAITPDGKVPQGDAAAGLDIGGVLEGLSEAANAGPNSPLAGPALRTERGDRRRSARSSRQCPALSGGASRSARTSRAALRPGTPVTPPPGCAPEPARYRPSTGHPVARPAEQRPPQEERVERRLGVERVPAGQPVVGLEVGRASAPGAPSRARPGPGATVSSVRIARSPTLVAPRGPVAARRASAAATGRGRSSPACRPRRRRRATGRRATGSSPRAPGSSEIRPYFDGVERPLDVVDRRRPDLDPAAQQARVAGRGRERRAGRRARG